eukprot:1955463-Pleurochrysis_carterae.AAC.1
MPLFSRHLYAPFHPPSRCPSSPAIATPLLPRRSHAPVLAPIFAHCTHTARLQATEIQNIQIADGAVCRGWPIPLYMVINARGPALLLNSFLWRPCPTKRFVVLSHSLRTK